MHNKNDFFPLGVRHSGVPRGGSSPLAPPGSSKNTKLKVNYV